MNDCLKTNAFLMGKYESASTHLLCRRFKTLRTTTYDYIVIMKIECITAGEFKYRPAVLHRGTGIYAITIIE